MASSYKADETVQIDGHVIPKGTIIIGNLFSLGMNPEDFRIGVCDVPFFNCFSKSTFSNPQRSEPLIFKPERHLQNGIFKKHPRIKPFSVGLRDCPGKRIAKLELFHFTAAIIRTFRIDESPELDNLEIAQHYTLYKPNKVKLIFNERS